MWNSPGNFPPYKPVSVDLKRTASWKWKPFSAMYTVWRRSTNFRSHMQTCYLPVVGDCGKASDWNTGSNDENTAAHLTAFLTNPDLGTTSCHEVLLRDHSVEILFHGYAGIFWRSPVAGRNSFTTFARTAFRRSRILRSHAYFLLKISHCRYVGGPCGILVTVPRSSRRFFSRFFGKKERLSRIFPSGSCLRWGESP